MGNLGDALILSAVLRAGHEATGERFGVHRIQPASSLFVGHPAVAQIACVDLDEGQLPLQRTDFWSFPFSNHPKDLRPYARLSLMLFGRVFGEDSAWAPLQEQDYAGLDALPFREAPILLATGVDSPRKEWPHELWAELVAGLSKLTPLPLVLVGTTRLRTVPGALNVSGLLRPRELLALTARARACISVDPFVTQAARMHATPTLNILGPTSPQLCGDPSQVNVHACEPCEAPCLDAQRKEQLTPCPRPTRCMARISAQTVLGAFEEQILSKLSARQPNG